MIRKIFIWSLTVTSILTIILTIIVLSLFNPKALWIDGTTPPSLQTSEVKNMGLSANSIFLENSVIACKENQCTNLTTNQTKTYDFAEDADISVTKVNEDEFLLLENNELYAISTNDLRIIKKATFNYNRIKYAFMLNGQLRIFTGDKYLTLDSSYEVVSVKDLGHHTYPGLINALYTLPNNEFAFINYQEDAPKGDYNQEKIYIYDEDGNLQRSKELVFSGYSTFDIITPTSNFDVIKLNDHTLALFYVANETKIIGSKLNYFEQIYEMKIDTNTLKQTITTVPTMGYYTENHSGDLWTLTALKDQNHNIYVSYTFDSGSGINVIKLSPSGKYMGSQIYMSKQTSYIHFDTLYMKENKLYLGCLIDTYAPNYLNSIMITDHWQTYYELSPLIFICSEIINFLIYIFVFLVIFEILIRLYLIDNIWKQTLIFAEFFTLFLLGSFFGLHHYITYYIYSILLLTLFNVLIILNKYKRHRMIFYLINISMLAIVFIMFILRHFLLIQNRYGLLLYLVYCLMEVSYIIFDTLTLNKTSNNKGTQLKMENLETL